jgi:superfamily II DNA/RNA helicase
MTFADLQIPAELIAALAKQQITDPTPIQIAALPVLLAGRNAYLHAPTGTGKTLAYLLPLFCRLDARLVATQTVIVAPTHELAIQIHRQCCDLAQNATWDLRSVLLIGGTAMDRQIDKLKKKPHVVVGSPGRIGDLISKGKLKLQHVRSLVIDEADRLLSPESIQEVQAIIKAAPPVLQLVCASATLEPHARAAIETLTSDAVILQPTAAAIDTSIEHLYLVCEERDKPDELRKLLHALDPPRAIVFVHRNDDAAQIAGRLMHHKISATDLSAALDKHDRKQAMDGFRNGSIRVLVASDSAARGLDIKGVTHVFNFDVPTLSNAYLHRVGRTGRAGAGGLAVTLATEIEARVIPRYQEQLGIAMRRVRMREGRVMPVGGQ